MVQAANCVCTYVCLYVCMYACMHTLTYRGYNYKVIWMYGQELEGMWMDVYIILLPFYDACLF